MLIRHCIMQSAYLPIPVIGTWGRICHTKSCLTASPHLCDIFKLSVLFGAILPMKSTILQASRADEWDFATTLPMPEPWESIFHTKVGCLTASDHLFDTFKFFGGLFSPQIHDLYWGLVAPRADKWDLVTTPPKLSFFLVQGGHALQKTTLIAIGPPHGTNGPNMGPWLCAYK